MDVHEGRIIMIVCNVILLMKICLQEIKLIKFILAKECQKKIQNLSFMQLFEIKHKI